MSQIALIKKLATEVNVHVDYNNMDKNSASNLINELAEKKKTQALRMVK